MKENNIKIESEPISFGPGYRKFTGIRKVDICPICSSSEPDIVLEELPTEQFRFEKNGVEGDDYTRIRSDVSMLLHAADMAKKYGPGFVQSMIDMRRPKSSAIQTQMDQLSDAQILDTIKSRHLQSPSELIAWSEHLIEQAKEVEQEAERIALENEAQDPPSSEASISEPSQSE